MPRNAVQKLQEIQKDINTVISLYEVANNTKANNDKPETSKKQNPKQLPQVGTPRHLETIPRFDKFREIPGKPQGSLLDTFKKASSFFTRPSEGLTGREPLLKKKWMTNKPGSAPSFSGTRTKTVESDYVQHEILEEGSASEGGIPAKAKEPQELKNSDWLPTYDVVMTPSKTLETAKEVLEKNNFKENEETEKAAIYYKEKRKEKSGGGETVNSSVNVKKSPPSEGKIQKGQDKSRGRSRSISPKEEISVSHFIECSIPAQSKSVVTAKLYNSKDKSVVDISPKIVVVPRDDQKTDRKPSHSGNPKNVTSSKQLCSKTKMTTSDNNQAKKDTSKTTESKKTPPGRKIPVLIHVEKSAVVDKVEGKQSSGSFETQPKFTTVVGDLRTNQKAEKPAEQIDDAELVANDLSKVLEKSNEKLEKMKISKELALDIANHFKERYDGIQKSKEDLVEKLQMLEKNNEKLSNEVKEARELTRLLQMKIQGLEEHSIQETQEVDQLKNLTEEIEQLRAQFCESEKQYNAQLYEKNKKIEEIQIDRLQESKNGLKHQEILAKKLQRLTQEKCELLLKFEELQRQLHDSHRKTKTLEDNIRQLEEEVQKQKQHLKIKTETLHETNRELEMIRLNCTDLEEQVKMLRKSMEEFDGIQHSLIRKTTDYEEQIKSNQEKIKDLQGENIRLKSELENERDGLRIKNKIIEDQQQTIRQLKEKSEDAKSLLRENQSLEKMLNTEREEKLELQEAVQVPPKRLKWRKEQLKKKVKTLENDFLLAPQEVVRDLQKTQVVLHELENQVQTKQKEWELQLQSLIREKEQACSVAEFATKKLMETTNEYQKQSQAYKGLQRLVAGNLAARERQNLREGNKKAR